MTDHTAEAERFHSEYRRIRTPDQLRTTSDVLALANYHATMAVVDAVRGSAPKLAGEPRCWATEFTDDGREVHWKRCARSHPHNGSHQYVDVAPPRATGWPQSDEQPEPGQVDGGKDAKPARERVDPEWIKAQRKQGWPDMHPEDYCHRCGNQNPMWCTDRDTWLTATEAWATETGREGICCFDCLAQMMPGKPPIWWIVPLPWIAQHDAERNEELTAKAEAERDAILAELHQLHEELGNRAAECVLDVTKRTHWRIRDAIESIINRHTPED